MLAIFCLQFQHTHARNLPLARYAVILVLDGAPPRDLTLGSLPNLHWLQRHGVTYTNAWVGQEIANTPPSHATIGTGVFPSHHGVQGFWWKDPTTNTVTRPTDNDQVQRGALEAVLAQQHVPSIAASVKAMDPHARVLAASGHKCYAADAMGTGAADYVLCALIYHDRWVAQAMNGHMPPPGAVNNSRWDVPIPNPNSGFAPAVQQWNLTTENHWTMQYALWAFKRVHYPRVMMLNLPETDVIGHFATDPDKEAKVLMQGFDRDLGTMIKAYRQAGILSRTTFVVLADHGMSQVQTRLPFSVLDQAIHNAGATKVFLEADMGAVIGIKEANKARAVALNVAHLGGAVIDATYYKTCSSGRCAYHPAYERSDLPLRLRQAYRMLANTDASPSGADVFAVYAPHVTTGDRPTRGYHWVAGHLGPQWDEQHIPLVIAGAGVRQGVTSGYPARLVDIAPTVDRLLGAPTGRVDGIVLADALAHSTRAETETQRRRSAFLLPFVRAIEQRSGGG